MSKAAQTGQHATTCTTCGFVEQPGLPPQARRHMVTVIDESGSRPVCDLCVYVVLVAAIYAGLVGAVVLTQPVPATEAVPA